MIELSNEEDIANQSIEYLNHLYVVILLLLILFILIRISKKMIKNVKLKLFEKTSSNNCFAKSKVKLK